MKNLIQNLPFTLATLVVALSLVIAVILRPASHDRKGMTHSPQVGFLAPDFQLVTLEGKATSLAHYVDKVVLVNFWATWCVPCKEEMPSMERLYQDLRSEGFEILAVSVDYEGAKVVGPFVRSMGLSYPILLDQDLIVEEQYQIFTLPTSLVLNRKGMITHKIVGQRDWNSPELRTLVMDLLARAV